MFLQTDSWFQLECFQLRRKLLFAACEVDANHSWGLLPAPSQEKTRNKDTMIDTSEQSDLLVSDEERDLEQRCIALGCNVRVAEYHVQIAPSPALPDIYHKDADSLVTIDVMLTDSTRFSGGVFQTLEC